MAPRETRRAVLLSVAAIGACGCLAANVFVSGMGQNSSLRGAALTRGAGGEYTGFVPDMQRRTLMNVVITAASAIPVGVILGGFLWYLYPPMPSGGSGGITAGDKNGNAVTIDSWKKTHNAKSVPELLQGFAGDPTYVFSTDDGIKDFAADAVCTHLGCVVPWSAANNKFICPCHGSQYAPDGHVVRGPAPLPLALAHCDTGEDGKIMF